MRRATHGVGSRALLALSFVLSSCCATAQREPGEAQQPRSVATRGQQPGAIAVQAQQATLHGERVPPPGPSQIAGPARGPARDFVMPSLSGIPEGWTTDRYEPCSFSNVGTYAARENVLGIEICADRGLARRSAEHQTPFYSTQGRRHVVDATSGAAAGPGSVLSADLFVPSAWSEPASGTVATELWGEMTAGEGYAWPIIGFTNEGRRPRYRVWDNGWIDLDLPVAFGGWSSFAIELTQDAFLFSVNGQQVYVDRTTEGATWFRAVILQAQNYFDDSSLGDVRAAPYTAYWSNTPAQQVPPREPGQ